MQRVAIARALVNNPEIILADEPTGNLDSENSERIFELLRSLKRDGLTVVMITHNAELASRADRLVRLKDGTIHLA
jgi:ABC-type lipoprotein export system ATPase subunit